MAAPLFFALAAMLSVSLLLSEMPTVAAAELQPIIIANGSACSGMNGASDGEDGGCFTIGQVQPELEGFEMTVDLSSGGVVHRSLLGSYNDKTGNSGNPNRANCDRDKAGQRYSCTTDPKYPPPKQKCSTFTRGNPC